MKALSIRQPWAWLIVNRFKDIENRGRRTNFRGDFLIHSPMQQDQHAIRLLTAFSADCADIPGLSPEEADRLRREWKSPTLDFSLGGIVGKAMIFDCVRQSDSPWFTGPWGYRIADAKPLSFKPCRGMLGFFEVNKNR